MPAISPTSSSTRSWRASLCYLTRKEAPFRFIDTHAGAGRYDLSSDEARRSPEWREGIARVLTARPTAQVARALAPLSSGRRSARRRRPAASLSGLAGDRPDAHAGAGSHRALRGEPRRTREVDRCAWARRAAQHRRHGRLCRAQRLPAAQGAPRHRADRPAVRDARRSRQHRDALSSTRCANGRPGPTSRGVRSATLEPTPAFSMRSPRSARRTSCGSNSTSALGRSARMARSR